MENLEIKITCPEATHDCNKCNRCQKSIISNKVNKCGACRFLFFEKIYQDFSSGNKVVDEIIKNPVYNKYELNHYEWIPWIRLWDIKKIGEGGFSTIYKATYIDGFIDSTSIKHHSSMEYKRWGEGMEVAIKFIKASLQNSEEVFKELNIQRTKLINNGYIQNITSIYGITRNAETLEYGVVMEFAQYGDIRKYLSTNFHSASWSDKLSIARYIAEGLETIHYTGMIHRDLHSGNILQYAYDDVSIGDLGLCRPINSEIKAATTTTGEKKGIYGVIPYIPPEVLRGETFTTAGDIYSLGMVLWELATGKLPFHDCSHDKILVMGILNGQRPEIISPLIPSCIAEIIEKCWEANLENRPTAREVYENLERLNKYSLEFQKSEKYIKEHVEDDNSLTKTSKKFSKYIKFPKKIMKRDKIEKARVIIHPGAIYTSRLLTAQMVDFSTGLFV
ncbi:hypothetical protein G9A89_023436 [Geosiphon pyriformis]|nr:hypothetical protein G9A89_023436 [Geosiphon pyriformis]